MPIICTMYRIRIRIALSNHKASSAHTNAIPPIHSRTRTPSSKSEK